MKLKLLITVFLFSQISCKKDPFDYRNKFIGNFNFSVHKRVWVGSATTSESDYTYSGSISNKSDDEVNIKFLDNVTFESFIYEDGSLKFQNLTGEFESTMKLKFQCGGGGLGGGTNYSVVGVKTK